MTREELEELFESDYESDNTVPSRILAGIEILKKYDPDVDIEAAEHDIIYTIDVDSVLDAGLTKEDAEQLHKYGWMIEEDCFAHYV